jgi:hypothetical protein
MPVLLLFKCTDIKIYLAGGSGVDQNKVAGDKGISETKSKQSPCSNCMHQPLMSWGNECSTCMHKPVMCMNQPVHHRPMHALTAWDLKFQVCLGYTFTPPTLISAAVFLSFMSVDLNNNVTGLSRRSVFQIKTFLRFVH